MRLLRKLFVQIGYEQNALSVIKEILPQTKVLYSGRRETWGSVAKYLSREMLRELSQRMLSLALEIGAVISLLLPRPGSDITITKREIIALTAPI